MSEAGGFVIAICESCGSPSEPGALFCAHCGTLLKAAATEHLPASSTVANEAAPAIAAVGATPANDGNAFTWPFAQKNWFLSLWILLIGWIPLMTVSIGWMIEAIGRRGRGEADLLPHARNVLRMLAHGILYWLMFVLYLAVPIWLLGAILTAETAIITEEFNHWATASIENSAITAANVVLGLGVLDQIALIPQQDLLSLLEHWAAVYTAGFVAPVIWVVFALPVFVAATIRLAVTGKLASYFRPFANTGFVLSHFVGFMWLFAVTIAVNLLFLLIPVVGWIIWLTMGVWIIAYYAGNLAKKLHPNA
jgi:hypothetical protein